MKTTYTPIEQYSFEDSWTIVREVKFLGMTFLRQPLEQCDMLGKRTPLMKTEAGIKMVLHCTRMGYTTYKWVPLYESQKRIYKQIKDDQD